MAYGLPDWVTGSSKSEQPAAAPKTGDGGRVAPDRNSRELCYESRDIFFECLDKNNILDAIREDEKARKSCPQEVADYERDCARSWVRCLQYPGFHGLQLTYGPDKILQREEGPRLEARPDDSTDTERGCRGGAKGKGRTQRLLLIMKRFVMGKHVQTNYAQRCTKTCDTRKQIGISGFRLWMQ